jgi:hypothetical protein
VVEAAVGIAVEAAGIEDVLIHSACHIGVGIVSAVEDHIGRQRLRRQKRQRRGD